MIKKLITTIGIILVVLILMAILNSNRIVYESSMHNIANFTGLIFGLITFLILKQKFNLHPIHSIKLVFKQINDRKLKDLSPIKTILLSIIPVVLTVNLISEIAFSTMNAINKSDTLQPIERSHYEFEKSGWIGSTNRLNLIIENESTGFRTSKYEKRIIRKNGIDSITLFKGNLGFYYFSFKN